MNTVRLLVEVIVRHRDLGENQFVGILLPSFDLFFTFTTVEVYDRALKVPLALPFRLVYILFLLFVRRRLPLDVGGFFVISLASAF